MSQRVRNSSHPDPANEMYARPLRKKEKPVVKNAFRGPRDMSATRRPCEKHATAMCVNNVPTKLKPTGLRQQNATKPTKTVNDCAKERLETPPKPPEKAPKNNKRASWSWGTVLQEQTEKSTFHHFDPLRTLHFLTKELQLKVRSDFPGKYIVS